MNAIRLLNLDLIDETFDFVLLGNVSREPDRIDLPKLQMPLGITYATTFPGPVLYFSTTVAKDSCRLPVMYTSAPLATKV